MNDDFDLANRVFELFTLSERAATLRVFARLRQPFIEYRFVEAVHAVVRDKSDHHQNPKP